MPEEPKPVIIETRNLIKDFCLGDRKVRVLKGISTSIYEGEFIILFGPSGSGKTTFLNMIAGLDRATAGQVIVRGLDISKSSSGCLAKHRLNNVGIVFQDFNLIQSMTALQNVTLPLIFNNCKYKERVRIARKLLTDMGLEDRIEHKPIELSGGEQQRVAIARALVNSPDILIIDEPTGNLDKKSADEIIKIICSLNKNLKRTIVLVTHNPNYLGLADRVLSMQDGKIVSEMKGKN